MGTSGIDLFWVLRVMTRDLELESRRFLVSRRIFKQRSKERDDRGWTLLHIGARKGDLKEVSFSLSLFVFCLSDIIDVCEHKLAFCLLRLR